MKARRSWFLPLWIRTVRRQQANRRAGDWAKDRTGGQSDIAQLADAPPDGVGYNSLGGGALPACVADREPEAQTRPLSLMEEGSVGGGRGVVGVTLHLEWIERLAQHHTSVDRIADGDIG
jgi:hypothetical protein